MLNNFTACSTRKSGNIAKVKYFLPGTRHQLFARKNTVSGSVDHTQSLSLSSQQHRQSFQKRTPYPYQTETKHAHTLPSQDLDSDNIVEPVTNSNIFTTPAHGQHTRSLSSDPECKAVIPTNLNQNYSYGKGNSSKYIKRTKDSISELFAQRSDKKQQQQVQYRSIQKNDSAERKEDIERTQKKPSFSGVEVVGIRDSANSHSPGFIHQNKSPKKNITPNPADLFTDEAERLDFMKFIQVKKSQDLANYLFPNNFNVWVVQELKEDSEYQNTVTMFTLLYYYQKRNKAPQPFPK